MMDYSGTESLYQGGLLPAGHKQQHLSTGLAQWSKFEDDAWSKEPSHIGLNDLTGLDAFRCPEHKRSENVELFLLMLICSVLGPWFTARSAFPDTIFPFVSVKVLPSHCI